MFESFAIGEYRALALRGPAAPPDGGFSVSFTGDFGFWNRHPSPDAMKRQLEIEKQLLSRFDLHVINLEFILPGAQGGEADLACEQMALDYLKDADFCVASLANNHAAAFGAEGLEHNLEKLEGAGFKVIGLSDRRSFVFEGAGLRFGLYSLTDLLDDADTEDRILRSRKADISALHEELGAVDFRIGFPHLGSRSVYPSPHELSQAKAMLEAGTDLLIGTGAHFAKGFVELHGKPVCFGLGNHLFTWDGGGTEPVGMHLVANFKEGRLNQLFAVPFSNAIMRDEAGPLLGDDFDQFNRELTDRSTTDTSKFYRDPRTQSGALDRLRKLRWQDLSKLRPRHLVYGFRAVFAKVFKPRS